MNSLQDLAKRIGKDNLKHVLEYFKYIKTNKVKSISEVSTTDHLVKLAGEIMLLTKLIDDSESLLKSE